VGVLYLVRHGQAGTREDYDSLSDLGRRQARLLGEHFKAQGIGFSAVYSGALARQRETAEQTASAMGPAPAIASDPDWNEFDLTGVYREMAPRLAAEDEEFRRGYEEMRRALAASRGAHAAPVHRRWNECDKQVVRAWIEGRYPYSGESWNAFERRIHRALARVVEAGDEGNALVFTSATPIGVCAARTLEIGDGRAMWLAGVLFNASYSTLRIRGSEVRLFSFNTTAHLEQPELRTFR
jgi:broad specificity phosphatase PhoE